MKFFNTFLRIVDIIFFLAKIMRASRISSEDIEAKLHNSGIEIKNVDSNNYQERYYFTYKAETCSINIHYNKMNKVSSTVCDCHSEARKGGSAEARERNNTCCERLDPTLPLLT